MRDDRAAPAAYSAMPLAHVVRFRVLLVNGDAAGAELAAYAPLVSRGFVIRGAACTRTALASMRGWRRKDSLWFIEYHRAASTRISLRSRDVATSASAALDPNEAARARCCVSATSAFPVLSHVESKCRVERT